MKLKPYNS